FLGVSALRNQARGHRLDQALPAGYNLSLLGAVLFGIGGAIDMLWHLHFGIEVNLAALISPPHLLLMLAGTLIVAGPLRAAWRRPGSKAPWTAVLSASLLLSMLTFFNQFDEPLVDAYAAATSRTWCCCGSGPDHNGLSHFGSAHFSARSRCPPSTCSFCRSPAGSIGRLLCGLARFPCRVPLASCSAISRCIRRCLRWMSWA